MVGIVCCANSMNNDGISRKIGDIEERKKLKQILSSVDIQKGCHCKNCRHR